MNKNWQGKAVSIQCGESLGIFQGVIKDASKDQITIVRAFRNGLPLKTLDTEFRINAADIVKLDLIPQQNSDNSKGKDAKTNKLSKSPTKLKPSSPPKLNKKFANMIPTKVEVKMSGYSGKSAAPVTQDEQRNTSKPIDIKQSTTGTNHFTNGQSNNFKSEKKKSNQSRRNLNAFDMPIDQGMLVDFDFEKNLALFNKQAIWDQLDASQKPDVLPQSLPQNKSKNYRHNENVIVSKPTRLRQIASGYQCNQEFTTDDDLVIPSITLAMRNIVQSNAETMGLTRERQTDMLARGATELAIQLLGGARRLTPVNQHQWPTILIICDESYTEHISEVGLATGRTLASHGLKVLISVSAEKKGDRKTNELALARGCSNIRFVKNSFSDIPQCDLIILAVKSKISNPQIVKWINVNRSPNILAIDPPATGIPNVNIKYSILPILPIDRISGCGKLYLCNLGIPSICYNDAGIQYESPFGHKFVMPLHSICGDE